MGAKPVSLRPGPPERAVPSLRLHGDTLAQTGLLDFAVNVWPGQRPAPVERALRRALAKADRYPEEGHAKAAIAAQHRRATGEVLLLNGACEAFWLLAQVIRPRRAVCVHPGFTEAEAALRATGTEVVRVLRRSSRHWAFNPAEVPEDAELVVLGNPNNPTGTLDPPEVITALARPWRLVIADESFIDFVPNSGRVSLAGLTDVPGLIVVRSLTKLWALPGIRAGYLLAPAELAGRLAGQRQPWSVNGLACAALAACAGDSETASRVAAEVASARAEIVSALSAMPGVRVWPSAANFLLLQVPDGPSLLESLWERRIAVRPGASFPGLDESYIRIAVRSRGDNMVLVKALAEVLS
jgi:histidinol-phosphate/aromatic aminotransferase/cobyric acid decarboxylase-like protein